MNRFTKTCVVSALAVFASSAALAETTLERIKRTGEAVMGVRESSLPLAYTLGEGKYDGYHVEICREVLSAVKAKLALRDLKILYTAVTSANRIPLMTNGTIDIECGSTTNNLDRQKEVAFAYTTYVTEVRTAVRANSGITSVSQLNGKTVVTTTGTTSVKLLRQNEKATGIDFKEILGKDHADSFLILEQGRADAFVMDDNLLAGNIANSKTPQDFKIVGEPLSIEPIAIMFRKDDPDFAKIVNDTIANMAKSGQLTRLYTKWFTSPIPPRGINLNLPMSENLKKLIANPNNNPAESFKK